MISRRELLAGTLTALLCVVQRASSGVRPKQAPKRLIFVHGRSRQGRDSAALMQSEWIAAPREGARKLGRALPIDLEIVLPYYGDKLDWFITEEKAPLASDIQNRVEPGDREFVVFQAKIAEELRVKAHIADDQVNAEYGANRMPRGPLNRWWVQATLRALEKYGAGMTRNTIETFTRDVFLYATRPDIRDEIHRIVSKHLTEAPTVIVGHSLGSVVAYNILCTAGEGLQVPLFVTLGSPLGIPAVRTKLLPLRFPSPPLGAWYNAFDTRDSLALYPLDKDNFPVMPAIENYGGVRNPTNDRHGIVGYLDDPNVTKKVLDALDA
jgi:hypothetical protein